MEEVTRFYLENSDGIFNIIPVISPTVTIPLDKYTTAPPGEGNLFDSSGNFIGAEEVENLELDDEEGIGELGMREAGRQNEKYDTSSHAFWGISNIELAGTTVGSGFTRAPIITFRGGNQNENDNNFIHPDFEPQEARAIVNANGEITNIEILNPGTWYYDDPEVLVNGEDNFR